MSEPRFSIRVRTRRESLKNVNLPLISDDSASKNRLTALLIAGGHEGMANHPLFSRAFHSFSTSGGRFSDLGDAPVSNSSIVLVLVVVLVIDP